MNAKQITIIEDFYILSEILDDDIDLICDIIKEKVPKSMKRYKRSLVKKFIEHTDYKKIHDEVCFILELPIVEVKEFKRMKLVYRRMVEGKAQTTIFDFI